MDSEIIAIIMLIAFAAVGIVLCFFGNKWLKTILAVYGFAVGFLLANALVPMLFPALSSLLVLLISLGAGIVGALLFIFFMYLGIFFIGFGAGIMLSLLLIDVFDLYLYDWYVYISVLIIGSIFGSLTLNKRRIFISIFTSYIGASLLAVFVDQVVNGIKMESLMIYSDPQAFSAFTSTVYLIAFAVLFIAGLVVQLAVTSKKTTAK